MEAGHLSVHLLIIKEIRLLPMSIASLLVSSFIISPYTPSLLTVCSSSLSEILMKKI